MRAISLTGLIMLAGCTVADGAANQTANVAANVSVPIVVATAAPTPVAAPAGKLAGVDFAKPVEAFGTEPYWGLKIEPGKIHFSDGSVGDGLEEDWVPAAPVFSGKQAVIKSKTPAGLAVTITLTGESCLEVGEEDNRVPLTAMVKIGDRTLMGCAGPHRDDEPADNVAG